MRWSQWLIAIVFSLILSTMLFFGLESNDPYSYGTEFISLILLWIPPLLAWSEVIELPWPIYMGIGVALSLHSLGLITQWYDTISWYGYITHFVSGIVVASLAATLLLIIMHFDDQMHIPVKWVPFFIFISVLALEGIWKIFEFTMDMTLGTRMQHGLADIMNDNLSDTIAGIVAGMGVAYYISRASIESFVTNLKMKKIGKLSNRQEF